MQRTLFIILSFWIIGCAQEDPTSEGRKAKADVLAEHKGWEELDAGQYAADGTFYSEDGRFMIAFPDKPEHSVEVVQAEAGRIKTHTYMYSPSSTEAYMVFYADYPSNYVGRVDKREMLFSALEGALKPIEVDGTEFREEFELNGHPAMEFKASGPSLFMAGRIYLIHNRLYQISIIKDGGYPSTEVIRHFLDSFYLIE